MSDLGELAKKENVEALLLAEVAAWLHDYRKCSDEHLQVHSKSLTQKKPPALSRDEVVKKFPKIKSVNISLLNDVTPFVDLLRWDDKRKSKPQFRILGQYLIRCHHTAHLDKPKPPEGEGEQDHRATFLSSPFGYEGDATKVSSNLTTKLFSSIQWDNLSNFQMSFRSNFFIELEDLFSLCGADTQRPINEIALWNWGHTVGSLYKSALAGAVLGFIPQANDLRWRLLSIRFDGFSFFAQSTHLPDLLARRNLLVDVLDEIRNLLEITYPIGAEIYRDENGSVFVVPGCEKKKCSLDLLALQDDGKTLRKHILDKSWEMLEGELIPDINLDVEPWYGQDPEWSQKRDSGQLPKDDPPLIHKHLKHIISGPESIWVNRQWDAKEEQICTVCGLRPQGFGAQDRIEHYQRIDRKQDCPPNKCQTCKAISRGVCSICEERRDDRSNKWAKEKLKTTIWIDEVADLNARTALIVGRFDLTHWLSGNLVNTLTFCNPATARKKIAAEVSKIPSFARLRRIWKTTHRFWQDVCPTDEKGDLMQSLVGQKVGQDGPRLEIRGKIQSLQAREDLGSFHAYDLVLPKGVKMSVVWDPDNNRFITGDNLEYINGDGQMSQDVKDVLNEGAILDIEELIGTGTKNKESAKIILTSNAAEIPESKYTPAIPILAEPLTFMALVPADKALQVAEAIRIKYNQEMAKVRNRLPMHLGIVYAHRHTPLRAVLDAGRRMLQLESPGKIGDWIVLDDVVKSDSPLPIRAKALGDGTSQFKHWSVVRLKNQRTNRELNWLVPSVMGDGETVDDWYPYTFWRSDKDGNIDPSNAADSRSRYFQAANPWDIDDQGNPKPGWLVHAGELKRGDQIYFTPATLDFQWLDSAGRRFEIAYDSAESASGQRRGLPRRPYLLDELEELQTIWEMLKDHLSKTQIHVLRDLIEAKREEWQVISPTLAEFDQQGKPIRPDNVFWQFCYDSLANAEWNEGKMPWEVEPCDRDIWLAHWANHAARGWITDVVELYLQIMKEDI